MEQFTMQDDAVQLEPADEVHRMSGFAAKLTVGSRAALLTTEALTLLVEHGGRILAPAAPPSGTITTAQTGSRR